MNQYKKLTFYNYKKYEKDFLSLKDKHIKSFIDKIISFGASADKIDYSPESLIIVWEFSYDKIKKISPVPEYPEDKLPIWFYIHEKNIYNEKHGYTIDSLWLIDGLVYYLGEVLIKSNKELKWEAFYEKGSRMNYQYKPVIKGFKRKNIYPFNQIFVIAVNTWLKDENNNLLKTNIYDAYNSIISIYKK